MRGPVAVLAALAAAAGALSAGCHRPRAQTAATPVAWPAEDHCWWALFRTAIPPDSVAARFARAYTTLGLSDAMWSHQADTAWAQSGPTVLADSAHTGVYAARVVAFRRGDSTFFRTFVAIKPDGSENLGRQQIGFCAETMREAKAAAAVPRSEERTTAYPSGGDAHSNRAPLLRLCTHGPYFRGPA